MPTRAHIIVETRAGQFKVIYTHSDGYPSWMGVHLDRFHNTPAAAKKIVSLGSCSVLGPRLVPNEGEKHGFDYADQAAFCSVFYKRDRNEGGRGAHTVTTLQEALECATEEWVYVWRSGQGWSVSQVDEPVKVEDLKPLADFIRDDEDCQAQIKRLDEEGQTVAWRNAGCPHRVEVTDYGNNYIPMPIGYRTDEQKRADRYQEEAAF